MKRTLTIALLTLSMIVLSGCTTMVYDKRNEAMRQRTENENMMADLRSLRERVDALDMSSQEMYRNVEGLKRENAELNRTFSDRLAEINRSLKAAEAARLEDRQQIIKNLSAKLEELMKASSSRVSQRTQSGYEHTVQSGQTLSEIAEVYGVKISVIVDANDSLKSANSIIRVGQRLFIPE